MKCGAWGCFDEFNRLDEAVLSAVSMQIQIIQDALRAHQKHCILLNKQVDYPLQVSNTLHDFLQIDLDPNSGIFITMNPAGKGYGGRQKLPDNLKQLFRPVAMTVPDNKLIGNFFVLDFHVNLLELKPKRFSTPKAIVMQESLVTSSSTFSSCLANC